MRLPVVIFKRGDAALGVGQLGHLALVVVFGEGLRAVGLLDVRGIAFIIVFVFPRIAQRIGHTGGIVVVVVGPGGHVAIIERPCHPADPLRVSILPALVVGVAPDVAALVLAHRDVVIVVVFVLGGVPQRVLFLDDAVLAIKIVNGLVTLVIGEGGLHVLQIVIPLAVVAIAVLLRLHLAIGRVDVIQVGDALRIGDPIEVTASCVVLVLGLPAVGVGHGEQIGAGIGAAALACSEDTRCGPGSLCRRCNHPAGRVGDPGDEALAVRGHVEETPGVVLDRVQRDCRCSVGSARCRFVGNGLQHARAVEGEAELGGRGERVAPGFLN